MALKLIRKEFLLNILLSLFLVVSLWQTYGLLSSHFTHYDDLGVAQTLLLRQEKPSQCHVNISSHEGGSLTQWANKIDCVQKRIFDRLTIVPHNWTYAPFQFWFTQVLLNPGKEYS